MTPILFKNGLIFDGHNPDLIADRHVLVKNGRIDTISDAALEEPGAQVVDLAGRVLMPGLIDCHFHAYACEVDLLKLESLPMTYVAQRGRHLAEAALHRGFTTVRDAGGADYGLWRSIEEGYVRGPRLFFSGRALSQTGGHVDVRAQHIEPCGCSLLGNLGEVVDGVDALRKTVRESLRQGAHQVKLMVSGGVASPTDPIWMLQFSDEEITAAVDEANRRRSYVMAHAYTAASIARAVQLGVRSIEHANLIDREAAETVARHHAYVVPTLVTYDAIHRYGKQAGMLPASLEKLSEVRLKGLEAIETCKEAGVKIGLGTDLLGNLHQYQLEELKIRSEIDTPFEVLRSATAINAEIVQKPGELGCIREGAHADLLIIDGNPLEDLSLLYNQQNAIDTVIKAGDVVHSKLMGPGCRN